MKGNAAACIMKHKYRERIDLYVRSRSCECNRFPRFITPRVEPSISFPDAQVCAVCDYTDDDDDDCSPRRSYFGRAGLHPFLVKRPSVHPFCFRSTRSADQETRRSRCTARVNKSSNRARLHSCKITSIPRCSSLPCWERGFNICFRRQSNFFLCIDPARSSCVPSETTEVRSGEIQNSKPLFSRASLSKVSQTLARKLRIVLGWGRTQALCRYISRTHRREFNWQSFNVSVLSGIQ